jgi:hypothetical protein
VSSPEGRLKVVQDRVAALFPVVPTGLAVLSHRRRRGGGKERSPLPWTGAPCSPQRTWAEKDGRSPPNAFAVWGKDSGQEQESLRIE